MAKITRAALHLSAEEIKTRLKQDPRPLCRQRWLIIYNALVDPREAVDIAKHAGTTVSMVHQVISNYNRLGVSAVETPGKGGRRHQYINLEGEQAFLAPFSAGLSEEKLRQLGKSSKPLKPKLDTRSMTAPSIVCSIVMAGANLCRVPGIQKRISKHKSSSKKLSRTGSSGSRHKRLRGWLSCPAYGAG